jgi:hypothetical protein
MSSKPTNTSPSTSSVAPNPPNGDDDRPIVDSGMIQVALALAAIGFLLFEFGKDLTLSSPLSWLRVTDLGRWTIFLGIGAALLLHSALWSDWITIFNRKSRHWRGTAWMVLLGYLTIYFVLAVAMLVAGNLADSTWGIYIAMFFVVVLLLASTVTSKTKRP